MKLSKDGDSSSFSVSVGLPRKSRIGNQEVIMMEWNSENDLINKHGMCSEKSEFQYLLNVLWRKQKLISKCIK